MHFYILFFICTPWSQLKTSYSFSFSFLYFSSQYGNKIQYSLQEKHNWIQGNTGPLELLPMNRTLLLSVTHFDTHLGLLSQVPILSSIQLLKSTNGVQDSVQSTHWKTKVQHNRNKLRVYSIYHHESHVSNSFPPWKSESCKPFYKKIMSLDSKYHEKLKSSNQK